MYNPNFHGLYAPAIGAGTVGIGGQISYPVVCQFLANGGIREFDAESRVPFAYHKRSWISYDDEQSLEEKVLYKLFKNWQSRILLMEFIYSHRQSG